MNIIRFFRRWWGPSAEAALKARSLRRRRACPVRPWLEALEDRTLLSGGAVNPIVAENQLAGTPQSVWDVSGAGDATVQGFATDISYNVGQTASFKINDTAAAPYHLNIYRMGYYGGAGARLVATIDSSQTQHTVQPNPITNNAVGLVDAGNWSVSATWAIPTTAVSGIYFADVVRDDTGGKSMIVFVVRNDASHSDLLFQTSDATWEAYNSWGGSSLYHTTLSGLDRAYQVSYNRPFNDRATQSGDGYTNWLMYDEYPMVRFLEANGYDVSYFTDVDADRSGTLIQNHKAWMDVGHDEYWSANEYNNVQAARDAGVNLAFFSGNEIFWKTYLSPSIDGTNTANRTLVTYKETHANAITDPNHPGTWTGAWADPRFNSVTDPHNPQNALSGTLFTVNRGTNDTGTSFTVPYSESQLRFWRNTSVANLQPGQTATLGDWELGYEWDEDVDNGFRPAGLIDLSTTTQSVTQKFTDYGNTVQAGTATHSLTLYRAASGALVFAAGMVQYDWGLDATHDGPASTPVLALQQATVNLFADMYVQPGSLQAGLVLASPSTNATPPTSTITSLTAGQNVTEGAAVTVSGTATAVSGSVVAGVEVSVDGGLTWHKATGLTSWSYTWTPVTPGPVVVMSRATDDSLNTEHPSPGVSVTVKAQATSTSGLVAAYNFDQGSGTTLTDNSGNGNNGTIHNATWVNGLFGKALSFDGSTSFVSIASSASLQLTNGMTLEAWVDPTGENNIGPVISKDRSGGVDYSLNAYDSNSSSHASVYTQNSGTPTSGADSLMSSSVLPLNTWSFLVATYDGSTLSFYVNGRLVTSVVYNYALGTSTGALELGQDALGDNFQGLLDNVRIYSRALNAGEIISDMNTPVGGTLDATAPTVSLTGPSNGATVSGVTTLTASASDNVQVGSVQFLLNGAALGTPVTSAPYSLTWDTRSLANGSYTLSAKATDAAGNTTTSAGVTVTVSNSPDATPPTVRINGPVDGSTVAGTIVLQAFASDPVGVSKVQFQLNGVNAGSAVTAAPYRLSFDTRTVAGGTYSLTAVATDVLGNVTKSSPIVLTIDNAPPQVSSETPANGATGVSTSGVLTAVFNKQIQSSTISFTLKDSAGHAVAGAVTYDAASNTATFTPNNALATSATYTATVSGATDIIGNVMTAPVSWSFTTSNTLTGATIFGNAATPAVASSGDSNAVELGVKFRSDVAGTVTGLRFYKGSGNTGTHVGHLWSSTGTLLATATFTSETATGWQQVTFSSPVSISANTTYIASYYAPVGRYAADTGYFASAGADAAPLHALASGVDGPDGVYLYASGGGFPTSSAGATNYWVDVVFSGSGAGPTVTAQTPAPNATGVSTSTTVTATFSESVQSSTITFTLKDSGGNTVASSVSYSDTTHTATLTPNAALSAGATYTATVSGAKDSSGSVMAAVTWSFTAAGAAASGDNIFGNATPANPSANDSNPVELGVKFRSEVAGTVTGLRFYKGSGNTGTHVGHLWTSTGTLLATATFTGESATGWQQVTFSSPVSISANTTYVASYYAPNGGYALNAGYFLNGGADNAPLHALQDGVDGGNGVYRYGTGGGFPGSTYNSANYWVDVLFSPAAEVTPVVTAQTPAPGDSSAATTTSVTATFNEAVQGSSISFVLKDASGKAVAATVSYDTVAHVATLTPTAALAAGATYTATVSGATDYSGDAMAAVSWSFTTAAGAAASGDNIFGNATPTTASANDSSPVELGVKFRSEVAGTITGLRFYKGASNTGTHVGHLWSSTGTLLATATFSNETATGWQQVTFSSPVSISANTTYIASYYAPNGGYASNQGYFASSGADAAPLHALASGVDGPNGLYLYASGGGFPTSSYNSTNYWVDVVFSPAAGVTPVVSARTPAAGSTTAATTTTVTATFNEAVQGGSISFTLADASGHQVAATVSYDTVAHVATLTPTAALAAGATYTATVSGATDFTGDAMAAAVTWSFTTAGSTASGDNIFGNATPAVASSSDSAAVELGVKFRSDVAGTVTGLRFYKGASNTGTHVGHLWSSTGTLLATATFSNETATGWQQVTFSSPVSISANTTYIASYYAPNGGYASNQGYFASSGADATPLHALASGVDGPNGLYLYSAGGGFPTSSFNSTNYWVDVVFSPAADTPPSVTAETPATAAKGISTGTTVTATFNEAVQAGSISFTLKDAAGNLVAAAVTYNSAALIATLTPNAALASNTTYTASVTATDTAGTAMSAPTTWTFTTLGTLTQTTAADFNAGTLSGTQVTNTSGGEVQLGSGFSDDFSGTALSSSWTATAWQTGGGVSVSNSILSVTGDEVLSTQTFVNTAVEGRVSFAAEAYQHFGLATDLASVSGNSWAIFSTMGTSNTLYARVNVNGVTTDVSLGALPTGFHVYRVEPTPGAVKFYVDGALQTTITATLPDSAALKIALSAYLTAAPGLQADWVRQTGGTFTSSVLNAGRSAVWGAINWTASVPAGATMIVQTRSGNTATPDGTWSGWTTATSGATIGSPAGQYLQYRVIFITTDPAANPTLADQLATPVLDDLTVNWS
jgi:methionine-rich copper-binding protein CopC